MNLMKFGITPKITHLSGRFYTFHTVDRWRESRLTSVWVILIHQGKRFRIRIFERKLDKNLNCSRVRYMWWDQKQFDKDKKFETKKREHSLSNRSFHELFSTKTIIFWLLVYFAQRLAVNTFFCSSLLVSLQLTWFLMVLPWYCSTDASQTMRRGSP